MVTRSQSTSLSSQTLTGLRVAITRAAEEANSPAAFLRELGAEVLHYPSLQAVALDDNAALDQALQDAAAGHFEWLVLTTASTVFALADRLASLGVGRSSLTNLPVAGIRIQHAACRSRCPARRGRACSGNRHAGRAGSGRTLDLRRPSAPPPAGQRQAASRQPIGWPRGEDHSRRRLSPRGRKGRRRSAGDALGRYHRCDHLYKRGQPALFCETAQLRRRLAVDARPCMRRLP